MLEAPTPDAWISEIDDFLSPLEGRLGGLTDYLNGYDTNI